MSDVGHCAERGGFRSIFSLLAAIVSLAIGASILAAVFAAGPIHALRCVVEGRDGWTVELPSDLLTPEDVKRAVQAQTTCVSVEVGYVDWGIVGEGQLAVPVNGPRTWVPLGGAIEIWVEGSAAQASEPCAPLGPSAAPPAGCPGGPQLAE